MAEEKILSVFVIFLGVLEHVEWLLKDGAYDSANEVMQAVGINKSSDELLFTGVIQVEFNGKTIDLADFSYGTAAGSLSFLLDTGAI